MNTFRVVLEGRCIDGFTAETVKTGLSRLMRVNSEVVEEILQGHDSTVKRGLDQATGDQYLTALRAVGMACRLEPENLEFDVASGTGHQKKPPVLEVQREFATVPSPVAQALFRPIEEPLAPPYVGQSDPAAAPEYVRPKGTPMQENKVSKVDLGTLHPWRRYFAKLLDLFVIALIPYVLLIAVIGYLFPEEVGALLRAAANPIFGGVFLLLIWIPTEATLLAVVGNTPARWLFGVSVRSPSGGKLSFIKAAQRSFSLGFQGLGFGIFFFGLIANIYGYRCLIKTGTTPWDSAVGSVVSHVEWGVVRAVFCVLITISALFLLAVLNKMGG